jgi:hypothetical protein
MGAELMLVGAWGSRNGGGMYPSGCPSGVTAVTFPIAWSWRYFKNSGFLGAALKGGPAKATPAEAARKSPIVRIRINFMILLEQAIFFLLSLNRKTWLLNG